MRIKDDEWNIYRRYSQFSEMHKKVSLLSSLFLVNRGFALGFYGAILPSSTVFFPLHGTVSGQDFQLFPRGKP